MQRNYKTAANVFQCDCATVKIRVLQVKKAEKGGKVKLYVYLCMMPVIEAGAGAACLLLPPAC